MERQNVTIKLFSAERYDGDWPPESATEFLLWFQKKLAMIPPEYLDSAKIEIDATGGYESSYYATLSIEYERPETDAEIKRRIALDQARLSEREASERALLAKLQQKYGAP